MNPIFDKLKNLIKMSIPYSEGYVGFFEPKEGFNKLIAYAKEGVDGTRFLWIHRDYRK